MAVFLYGAAGNTEAQQLQAQSFLFKQDTVGKASTGVLSGLAVSQTTTASGSVEVGAGAAIAQASTLAGTGPLGDVSATTLDVFTSNPMGGVPRNDIVVIDRATMSIRVVVGTPNAVPTDPTVPSTAVPLARLRHGASATTIPSSKIDDLRVFTNVQARTDVVASSTAKAGKRAHWGAATISTDGSGFATITHGAGFTPTVVLVQYARDTGTLYPNLVVGTPTSTTFRVRVLTADESAAASVTGLPITYFCGE